MSIDKYGIVGDLSTAALINEDGNLAWLCWPDFDSEACFASLLGTSEHGLWSIRPKAWQTRDRRYLPGTNVLETTYSRGAARVTITDFMPVGKGQSSVVRIVRGVQGTMRVQTCFAPRFDYGSAQPRFEQRKIDCWSAVTGPHRLLLRSNVRLRLEAGDLSSEWTVGAGQTYTFALQYSNSYSNREPPALHAQRELHKTVTHWSKWIKQSTYAGPYKEAVTRSLLTLKALTYEASGGFVAAPTTSLPEKVGGVRNWDYRFCWLRDTTFSLLGLLHCGFKEDAKAWLGWLSRSVQGDPAAIKIMYGISGKREHSEWTAKWLPGYRKSRPVLIGNKASEQLQLDTFGELLDALYRARCNGMYPLNDRSGQGLELPLLDHLEKVWQDPDAGLWEFRSGSVQFTQSKVMAWVAFDRGIRMAKKFGMKAPVQRWRRIRKRIHAQVCRLGFDRQMNSFTQVYGTRHLDASLLLIPLVGFLPVDDPRVTGTVRAIEQNLLRNGLLLRYDTARVKDGLPAGEGAFLACNFWLVEVYVLQGRRTEAIAHFEKLLRLRNNLGLLSEEYDLKNGLIGNFPQAFSHIGLINAALALQLGTSVRLHDLQ